MVISFRPDRTRYKEGSIGDYELVFNAGPKVKPETKYRISTRLEVSDYRYQQHLRYGSRHRAIEGVDHDDIKYSIEQTAAPRN